MTREEYLSILRKKISRLPKEEYETAMNRIIKRFDDAGDSDEQKVISELGDPNYVGDQIILDLAINNASKEKDESTKSVKGNVNAVWVGILAVLAGPVALPIGIAILAVVFAIVLSVAAVIISLMITGVALVICSGITLVCAGVIASKSFTVFLVCIGATLVLIGVGCALTYGMYLLLIALLKRVVLVCSGIARKGGKR